jgi:hypothetical protein
MAEMIEKITFTRADGRPVTGRRVPVWDHFIKMERGDGDTTSYVDVVDLYAGCLTPLVAWWSERFYRHRQRRWQSIVQI